MGVEGKMVEEEKEEMQELNPLRETTGGAAAAVEEEV